LPEPIECVSPGIYSDGGTAQITVYVLLDCQRKPYVCLSSATEDPGPPSPLSFIPESKIMNSAESYQKESKGFS
jgi:hypothetical protein